MKTIPVNKISFDKFLDCFIKRSENRSVLIQPVGKGYVQTFRLESGLEAKFWNCCFNEELVLEGSTDYQVENTYFTLALFLNLDGLAFNYDDFLLKENTIWDIVFISSTTTFKIHVSPQSRIQCLTISFSTRWLIRNLKKNNIIFEPLTEEIKPTSSPLLLEAMTSSDKMFIEELFDASLNKKLGTFYVKSAALKIVWDFFLKLKKEKCSDNPSIGTSIIQIEKYLTSHLTGSLPNLKDLAQEFSISESTLKRHFKRRHGVNMSAYFHYKKMEYAHQLISENKISVIETASIVGYRNVNHFIIKYNKHISSLKKQYVDMIQAT